MTQTKTKELHQLTKSDIAELSRLTNNLRNPFSDNIFAFDFWKRYQMIYEASKQIDLPYINRIVRKAVLKLQFDQQLIVREFFHKSDLSIEDLRNQRGSAAEDTIETLAKDLSLESEDIMIIFGAYREHARQFGINPERPYVHLKPEFFPIPPNPE